MASLNKVILVGRLTRDPETRYTTGGLALCKFSVAVDRRSKNPAGEKVTDFFYCTAFRQTAEYVQQWLGKGRLVAVEGRIEIDNVEQQDGSKRTYVNITCDSVQGLDSPRDSGGDNYGGDSSGDSQGGGYNRPQGNSQGGQQSGASSQGSGYSGGDDYNQNQPPAQAARPAAAPRPSAPANNAPAPSGNANPSGNAPAAQRPAPAPAYPEDDYDDADPFADE